MKKIITASIVVFILVILFSSCTVNTMTGQITVINNSDAPLKNLKVGNTIIASYVGPGAKLDYWYYSKTSGALTFAGDFEYPLFYKINGGVVDLADFKTLDNIECVFELNCSYLINAKLAIPYGQTLDKYIVNVTTVSEQNNSHVSYDVTEGYIFLPQ